MAKRKSKYNVNPPEKRRADGITFDSTLERDRYLVLRDRERRGVITDLELQRVFQVCLNGKKICKYKADFRYLQNGKTVVEDAKGVKTTVYRLKKKLVEAQYPIKITEITSATITQ